MIPYFTYIGTLHLIILSYKDLANKMLIDDRHNWFMSGLTIALLYYFKHSFLYVLILVIGIITLNIMLKMIKSLGDADINSVTWIYMGYGIINLNYVLTYGILFCIIGLIYFIIKAVMLKFNKISRPLPFYIVILISFVVTNITYSLYS